MIQGSIAVSPDQLDIAVNGANAVFSKLILKTDPENSIEPVFRNLLRGSNDD